MTPRPTSDEYTKRLHCEGLRADDMATGRALESIVRGLGVRPGTVAITLTKRPGKPLDVSVQAMGMVNAELHRGHSLRFLRIALENVARNVWGLPERVGFRNLPTDL